MLVIYLNAQPSILHMYDMFYKRDLEELVCMEQKPEAIDDILWGT